MSKHLDYNDRKEIERLHAQGKKGREISKYVGCSFKTVYNEIERGTVNGIYNPEVAQEKYETLQKKKGLGTKIKKDSNLAKKISQYILEEGLTLLQVVKRLRLERYNVKSVQSLYTAIDKGLIPNVTRETLNVKKTKIFSKGLFQIPKWARDKLNLKDGDEVKVCVENQRLIIEPNKNFDLR